LSLQLCEVREEELSTKISASNTAAAATVERSPLKSSPRRQELQRFGSDLSDVLHVASLRSSKSFHSPSSHTKQRDDDHGDANIATPVPTNSLNIPAEILALRNVKKQQKFIYRLAKGTNWRWRWINYLFWNINLAPDTGRRGDKDRGRGRGKREDDLSLLGHSSEEGEEGSGCDGKGQGDHRKLTAETVEVTGDSHSVEVTGGWSWMHRNSVERQSQRHSWEYERCGTGGSSPAVGYRDDYEEEEEVGEQREEDMESEVFTAIRSESTSDDEDEDEEEESWDIQFFDRYHDVDDSTMT
jgi:hypothetical protein